MNKAFISRHLLQELKEKNPLFGSIPNPEISPIKSLYGE
jgi:hypothetical protein